ncbi:MAG TPA: imidazole glycerol phosphate synthase subunit HisH [Mycobacteriales bacterium]|nr:imidazole glycerol phosphate synthase subunit HisH [Mycobacteriales bacterium]
MAVTSGARAHAPRVVVLDYGSGNIRSAQRALARVGADVTVTGEASEAAAADGLVVPGVGAFAACMSQLDAVRGGAVVRRRVAAGRPVLGICVGMQVLFERGDEHGVRTEGLGVLPGVVGRLHADVVPHIGWNTVAPPPGSVLFAGMDAGTRFYFVHSFAATGTDGLVAVAEHGEPFVAAVERGPVAATQFHPEKSGEAGAALLANWVRSLA